MDESNTDPKSNPYIPSDDDDPQLIELLTAREGPSSNPDKIELMLDSAVGKGADLGDGLRLGKTIGHEGYYVEFEGRSIGTIQALPSWALERIQAYFRRHPMGNELIPGLDEE